MEEAQRPWSGPVCTEQCPVGSDQPRWGRDNSPRLHLRACPSLPSPPRGPQEERSQCECGPDQPLVWPPQHSPWDPGNSPSEGQARRLFWELVRRPGSSLYGSLQHPGAVGTRGQLCHPPASGPGGCRVLAALTHLTRGSTFPPVSNDALLRCKCNLTNICALGGLGREVGSRAPSWPGWPSTSLYDEAPGPS